MQGEVKIIKQYTNDFLEFAKNYTRLHFLVARIDCGITGFRDENIAPFE